MSVTHEKLFESQRIRRVRGSDQNDVADVSRNQAGSAQNEGAHDDFADLRIALYERHHLVPVELDHFARLRRFNSKHRLAAG